MFKVSLFETSNPNSYEIEIESDFIDSIDFNDINHIIAGVCELLQGTNKLEFKVEGFGVNSWGTDIWYDLLTIIEQLSYLFEWIDNGGQEIFKLDFYGQGLETLVIFSPFDKSVKINCESGIDRKYDILTEFSTLKELNEMFSKLLIKFIVEAKTVLPNLYSNQQFQKWCESHNIPNRQITE